MPHPTEATPSDPGPSRRTFVKAGASSLLLAGLPGTAPGEEPRGAAPAADVEWRNKQEGMAYRRLGRTGLMVSEVVSGGDPITSSNYKHLELALEKGLNYLDMAPAYHGGDTEAAYGKLLAAAPGRRQKVFLATKVSGFTDQRERMYLDILKGLPESKQRAIRDRARALRAARGVEKPGYYLTYFPGQQDAFENAYIRVAMRPEYGHQVEGSPAFRRFIVESLEGSLKRLGTDHVDILMCPHGANTPEDLECPEIAEVFQDLKRQGKVRFLGVTSHNDPAGVLRAAADAGHYDVVMMAYNVINGGYVEEAIRYAASRDVGIIAMKVAMAVATHHTPLQPVPEWRIQKVRRIVPGDMKPPMKAYLWALQNPHIAAVISNLWDRTFIEENLSLVGRKVELQPA